MPSLLSCSQALLASEKPVWEANAALYWGEPRLLYRPLSWRVIHESTGSKLMQMVPASEKVLQATQLSSARDSP